MEGTIKLHQDAAPALADPDKACELYVAASLVSAYFSLRSPSALSIVEVLHHLVPHM